MTKLASRPREEKADRWSISGSGQKEVARLSSAMDTESTMENHGKTKMDKKERRRELPKVRRSRSLYREQVVRGTMAMSMERKKSDREAKKRQNVNQMSPRGGRTISTFIFTWHLICMTLAQSRDSNHYAALLEPVKARQSPPVLRLSPMGSP
ncbi:hypothetical protein [Absidia glauca]|uniref:Uncharacterized protein n=1 Tax=Absidia glauca TaxID=4829 RepID=A0A163URY8_ABSGL|nr:hypothetical protein [Absidia glauca]